MMCLIAVQAQRAASFVFELLAYLSESAVFLFLGMDVFALVCFMFLVEVL